MFSKNNLKYIFILAIGFFWCSSIYLTQEQWMINYTSENFINIVELLFGSLAMALGIITFGLLYKNNKNVRMYYNIFTFLCIVSMISFFATRNIYLMGISMCLTCFFGAAGFGVGYHFSLLSSNVEKEYRGRVFALGYAIGSIGTYLLVLLPESFYTTINSLLLYIPIIMINLYMVMKYTTLNEIKEEKYTLSFKNIFIKVSIIVLIMSLLSALSTDVIGLYTINISGGFGNTRIFYCLGLLIAGYLADKKNCIFGVITIVSFIFSLLSIILLKDGYSIKIVASLSYTFVAFFVLFRTLGFVNLVDNKSSIVWTSAFGLMYSRIIEGIIVLFEEKLINNYTLLIIVITVLLSVLIIIYFLMYYQNNNLTENDKTKSISVKYKLSIQEEKVLNLLMQGLSNQDIADKLFVSVNTVRNHAANIYKKTGMKKKELKEKIFL